MKFNYEMNIFSLACMTMQILSFEIPQDRSSSTDDGQNFRDARK